MITKYCFEKYVLKYLTHLAVCIPFLLPPKEDPHIKYYIIDKYMYFQYCRQF